MRDTSFDAWLPHGSVIDIWQEIYRFWINVDNGQEGLQNVGNDTTPIGGKGEYCGKAQQPHLAGMSLNATEYLACTTFNLNGS